MNNICTASAVDLLLGTITYYKLSTIKCKARMYQFNSTPIIENQYGYDERFFYNEEINTVNSKLEVNSN